MKRYMRIFDSFGNKGIIDWKSDYGKSLHFINSKEEALKTIENQSTKDYPEFSIISYKDNNILYTWSLEDGDVTYEAKIEMESDDLLDLADFVLIERNKELLPEIIYCNHYLNNRHLVVKQIKETYKEMEKEPNIKIYLSNYEKTCIKSFAKIFYNIETKSIKTILLANGITCYGER